MPKQAYLDPRAKAMSIAKKNLQYAVQYSSKLLQQVIQPLQQQDYATHITYRNKTFQIPIQQLVALPLSELFQNQQYIDILRSHQQNLCSLLPKGFTIQQGIKAINQNLRFGCPIVQVTKGVLTKQFTKKQEYIQKIQYQLSVIQKIQIVKDIKQKLQLKKPIKPMPYHKHQILSEQQQQYRDRQLKQYQTVTEQQFQDYRNDWEDINQQQVKEIFFKWQDRRKTQQQLLASSQDKTNLYKQKFKPTHYIKHNRSQKWVQNYRKQQKQRYQQPHLPWTIICQDGRKVIVPPVSKKASSAGSKPRDHPLLKLDRPSCVNILTLVRDSAARLPSGVGTRADICQLLKQSQYINDSISQERLSTIVSGALDRLHYNADSCVKYDSQRKLWLFVQSQLQQGADCQFSIK